MRLTAAQKMPATTAPAVMAQIPTAIPPKHSRLCAPAKPMDAGAAGRDFGGGKNGLGSYPMPGQSPILVTEKPKTIVVVCPVKDRTRAPERFVVSPPPVGIPKIPKLFMFGGAVLLLALMLLGIVLRGSIPGWRESLDVNPTGKYVGKAEDWVHSRTMRTTQKLTPREIESFVGVRTLRTNIRWCIKVALVFTLIATVVSFWNAVSAARRNIQYKLQANRTGAPPPGNTAGIQPSGTAQQGNTATSKAGSFWMELVKETLAESALFGIQKGIQQGVRVMKLKP